MTANDTIDTTGETTTLVFMCVRNAGRSQMATAFAERERDRRGLHDEVSVVTGGTDPADAVHDVVVDALDEVGLDVNGRTPRHVSEATLADADFVATMGCSTLTLDGVTTEDWALTDPGERPIEEVREIRDRIEKLVIDVFDRIEASNVAEPADGDSDESR
ncbi:low molecular weight phosphatase family protein [Halorubrum sp. DTA98]|uniref:arsenate-mycothiol transferase ArsC n=1 Tax=Halorubrum sp. DTA98 TaxID=3402163 RepID=UPI003AAEB44D